ncbi:MAG: pilus assembly protein N-terminal domain-containing protein [Acidobacteriaceae bacterium]|nr:pilus assembly protein N-terminal domain-containing protein [Acidobacteriaceae bacterium]
MKTFASALLFASLAVAQMRLPPSQESVAYARDADSPYASAPGRPIADVANGVSVTVNKSVVLEHAEGIRRLSISSPDIAEAVAVSSTELLLNGKSPGETTLILWDSKNKRFIYDVHVLASTSKLEAVRNELLKEVGSGATVTIEDSNVFLRGTVNDVTAAERAANIASTLGRVVNLLRVVVPPADPQILLKVRFANVSRAASSQLGFNFFSQNQKGISSTTTGEFGQTPSGLLSGGAGQGITLNTLLNIFYFRPDLNIGAVLQALEAKSLAQTLAEPNLLTVSGRQASFLAGGEFPFPTIQGGGAGVGQITIQFKEFGIRLNFVPTVTPRGTIDLEVSPEVSSLDYANGLTVNGFTVPGVATRRVKTEVELENGQSFVIAGLLDNELTHQLDKIPGIGNIPVLGKLFQSRNLSRSDDELLVMVTPQLVGPIPVGLKPPEVHMPLRFLREGASAPQNPGPDATGTLKPIVRVDTLPIEQLKALDTSAPQTGTPQTNAPAPNGTPNPAVTPQQPAVPAPVGQPTAPGQSTAPPPGRPGSGNSNP